MASRIVVTCPCCGQTQPVDVMLAREQRHDLDIRTHTITSSGRGGIAHWFRPVKGEEAEDVTDRVRALLAEAAQAFGLLDELAGDLAREQAQVRKLQEELRIYTHNAFMALKQSARAARQPMVKAFGRPKKVRSRAVVDGGIGYVASAMPGDTRVDGARVFDVGTHVVELKR